MHKGFLTTGSALAGLAVILGAFAAHKLKTMVPAAAVATFATGVQYMMYHALALLGAGMLYRPGAKLMKTAGYCFIAGILLFSGSLMVLTYKVAAGIEGLKWVGPITPMGGVLFVVGWLCFAISISRIETKD